MQWAGKQLKRFFQPKPADESPRRPTAEAHPQESRTKGQLKEEAVRLKSQLDALTAGLEVSVVNGTWVQRFIDLHQQHLEIGCRLEDGTVNVQAEVKRLQHVLAHSKVVAALDTPGLYRGRTGHLGPPARRTDVFSSSLDDDSDEAVAAGVNGHQVRQGQAAKGSEEDHDDLERSYDAFDTFHAAGGSFQPPSRQTNQAEKSGRAQAVDSADSATAAHAAAARKAEEERWAREAEEAARKAEEERLSREAEEAAQKADQNLPSKEAEQRVHAIQLDAEDLLGGPDVCSLPVDNLEDVLGPNTAIPTFDQDAPGAGQRLPASPAEPQDLLQATSAMPEKPVTPELESDEEDLLGGTSVASRPLATSADDDLLL
ncbi:unnamed protein product [Symbiodinium sp. CCMP2456]|nr:unnamed protein product [Symbiodinium sp. CCMP2456]